MFAARGLCPLSPSGPQQEGGLERGYEGEGTGPRALYTPHSGGDCTGGGGRGAASFLGWDCTRIISAATLGERESLPLEGAAPLLPAAHYMLRISHWDCCQQPFTWRNIEDYRGSRDPLSSLCLLLLPATQPFVGLQRGWGLCWD